MRLSISDHGIDERRLEMQAGVGDDADRLAKPHHQRLFGLIDREDRAVGDDDGDEQQTSSATMPVTGDLIA